MELNRIGQSLVTQQAVAKAAGVHASTVSLALRNDPRLRPETRDKVRAVAERLGYSENPLVSLLMARVRRGNVSYRGTIAFVSTAPSGISGATNRVWCDYVAGARRRAEQLGYKLDEFFLPRSEDGPARLCRTLLARDVAGVIVHHRPSALCPDRRLPFDVSPFCSVSVGVPLLHPQLNYVANDQFMRPVLAVRELLALGYRRPGLVIEDLYDGRVTHRCSAAFWAVQQYAAELETVPLLRLKAGGGGVSLRQWLRRHRPDVVLAARHWVVDALRKEGCRIPEEVGWVDLDWNADYAPAAGVHGNAEQVGLAATDMLASEIRAGNRGIPEHPICHMVPGSWVCGQTVRQVGPPADLDASFFSDNLMPPRPVRTGDPLPTLSAAR
jgi:DNA-binding LacI/PurR family transcriptional regulator